LLGEGSSERDRLRSAVQAQLQLLKLRKDEVAQAMAQVVVCRERLRTRLAEQAVLEETIQGYLAADRYDLAREQLVQAGLLQDAQMGQVMSRLERAQHAAGQKIAAYRQAEAELEQMQVEYQDSVWLERGAQIREQYESLLRELTERLSPRAAFERAMDETLRVAEIREAREEIMTDFAAALEAEIQRVLSQSPGSHGESYATQSLPPVSERRTPEDRQGETRRHDQAAELGQEMAQPVDMNHGHKLEDEPEWVRESRSPEEDVG
jgi:hypothetical protein